MRSHAKSGGGDSAARLMRALERGATLGIQAARTAHDRWRKAPPAPATTSAPAVPAAPPQKTEEVSAIEVRDLRAELTRELDRLAGAEIGASRGSGELAGETPSADGHS